MLMPASSNEDDNSEPMSLDSSPTSKDPHIKTQVQHFEISSSQRGAINFYSIHEIPPKYRHIFASYPCFNAVQSKVFDDVFYSDASVVVSAPTGSGKTVIFELAIVRLLIKLEEAEWSENFKIVYMAPIKALCSERYLDWKAKFSTLGLKCLEITGDTNEFELSRLKGFHLLLTTPEKWDSITRKWKDNCAMVQMVKLFLIDEVHLLNEENRGPTLEVVVSRMKTIQEVIKINKKQNKQQNSKDDETVSSRIRFMAISATIPNIEDVAQWLGTSHEHPATYFKMSEDMRPVKLKKIVLGYSRPVGISQFRFEMSMSYRLRAILFKYAEGKPTLIFCSTRKGVEQTCTTLAQQITFNFSPEQKQRLTEIGLSLNQNKLKDFVMAGVGYHHAGMLKEDRQTMEYLFREGLLPVLVTTSTLAMGVNLPAHMVIIKATQHYVNGAYHEYSETQILQMIGRAGRPQFDDSAVAVIMTQESRRCHYENLVSGKESIESNLHKHLVEHLNSEVVLRTVIDIAYAMEWIRSTFLYVRALKNPTHYGISAKCNKKNIESNLQEMCKRELYALASANLITLNPIDIKPTSDGVLMARYFLRLGTMKVFSKAKGNESLEDIIQVVATCPEFSEIQLRVNEKKYLNLLNKAKDRKCIRFPLPTKIMTREMKVNCLIQSLFGCLQVNEPSLKQDMLQISWIGQRVANALVQYLRQHPHYKALLNAVTFAKCFYCKLWENSPYVCKQLKGIGVTLATMLAVSNKTTFQSIINSNPRDLESIINRPPPMGNNLIDAVSHLPQFELNFDTESVETAVKLRVYISITNQELVEQENTAGLNHWLTLIVGDSNNKCLLHEKFKDERLITEEKLCWTVEIKNPSDIKEVYLDLISEQWVGLDLHTSFILNRSKQPRLERIKSLSANRNSPTKVSKSKADSCSKRNVKLSIVEQIKQMSEKRMGKTTIDKLQKFSFTPKRKIEHIPHTENENSCLTPGCPDVQKNYQNISENLRSMNKFTIHEGFDEHESKDSYSHVNETDDLLCDDSTTEMEKTHDFENAKCENEEATSLSNYCPFEIPLTRDSFQNHFRSEEKLCKGSGMHEYMNETLNDEISTNDDSWHHAQLHDKSFDFPDRIQIEEDKLNYSTTDVPAVSNISLTEDIDISQTTNSCWNAKKIFKSEDFLNSSASRCDEDTELLGTVTEDEKINKQNNGADESINQNVYSEEFSEKHNTIKDFSPPESINGDILSQTAKEEGISERVLKLPKTLLKHYYPIFNKPPNYKTPDSVEFLDISSKSSHMYRSQETEKHCSGKSNSESLPGETNGKETITCTKYETDSISQGITSAREVIEHNHEEKNKEPTTYSTARNPIMVKLQTEQKQQNITDRAFTTKYLEQNKKSNTLPLPNFNLINDFDTFFNEALEENLEKYITNSLGNNNADVIYHEVQNVNSTLHEIPTSNTVPKSENLDDKDGLTKFHDPNSKQNNHSSYVAKTEHSYEDMSYEKLDSWKKSQCEDTSYDCPKKIYTHAEMRNKQFHYSNFLPQTYTASHLDNSYLKIYNKNNILKTNTENRNSTVLNGKYENKENIPTHLEERCVSQCRINIDDDIQDVIPKVIPRNKQDFIFNSYSSEYPIYGLPVSRHASLEKISQLKENTNSDIQNPGRESTLISKYRSQVYGIAPISKQNFHAQISKPIKLTERSQFESNRYKENPIFEKELIMTNKYETSKSVDLLPPKQKFEDLYKKHEMLKISPLEYENLCTTYSQPEKTKSSSIYHQFPVTHAIEETQTYNVRNIHSRNFNTSSTFEDDFDIHGCKHSSNESVELFPQSKTDYTDLPPYKSTIINNQQKYNEFIKPRPQIPKIYTQLEPRNDYMQFSPIKFKTQLGTIPTDINNHNGTKKLHSEERSAPALFLPYNNKSQTESLPIIYEQTKKPVFRKSTSFNKNSDQVPQKRTLWERYLQNKDDLNANDDVSQSLGACFDDDSECNESLQLKTPERPEYFTSEYANEQTIKKAVKRHNDQNISRTDESENYYITMQNNLEPSIIPSDSNINKEIIRIIRSESQFSNGNSQKSTQATSQSVADSTEVRSASFKQSYFSSDSFLQPLPVTAMTNVSHVSANKPSTDVSPPTKRKCGDLNSEEDKSPPHISKANVLFTET